ncbi:MAG: hypothetical protein ACYC67_24525 [Prosthecobacter sp.]
MDSDESPIVGLHDLAAVVGMKHARKLMTGLHEEGEARKVLEEQEFSQAGRLDMGIDHFIDPENDGHISAFYPAGAYIYWWLRSKEMGGEPGDFWRSQEDVKWFEKQNPGCVVKNRSRNARSGFTGVIAEGTKYGDVRQEAGLAA